MIAKSFKSVGWVAAVAVAALSCYMVSLEVASERSDLAALERRIVAARQEIRALQTELGTRGRLQQLERWNAEVLALSAPVSGQYVENEVMLARFDVRQPTLEERTRVQLASADAASRPAPQPAIAPAPRAEPAAPRPTPQLASAQAAPVAERPVVRRASIVTTEEVPSPAPAARPAAAERRAGGLLDERSLRELNEASRQERRTTGDAD